MAIKNAPLESKFGFKSKNFTVDEDGNITATSLTLALDDADTEALVDFAFSENVTQTEFVVATYEDENPDIILRRTREYQISINCPELTFSIYEADTDFFYTEGLRHTDGTSGAEAVEKTDGIFIFRVPLDAPDELSYRGEDALGEEVRGKIIVQDPEGQFGEIVVTASTSSTSTETGALTVAGGAGIGENLYVGESIFANSINLDGVGVPSLTSTTNLDLGAGNKIVVSIDGSLLGYINSTGSTIPINNTTIENTVIGETSPSTANFVSASITEAPTTLKGATNKEYVDQTATALAVAFGL